MRCFYARADPVQLRVYDYDPDWAETSATGLGFALWPGHLNFARGGTAGLGCCCCFVLLFKDQAEKKSVF